MSGVPFLIIGLGNPGLEYVQTRHNAGFWFVEQLAGSSRFSLQKKLLSESCKVNIAGIACVLVKPTTFMNHSGQCVRAWLDWYKLSAEQVSQQMLVVHDELDLEPGVVRLKQSGGHGGHNGLRDIERHLGTRNYLRLRLGVGHPGHASRVSNYLTSGRPSSKEQEAIDVAIFQAQSVISKVVSGELPLAMNQLHTAAN